MISYSTADTEFVERLVKRIESEEYNKRPLRCFYAPWDIQPGENILLRIEKAEVESRFIGLVMSPDWLKSDWTKLERVMPVYDDPAGLKGRILPILRRNCNIPPSIRILNWLDFTREINFERETKRLLSRLRGDSLRPRNERRGDDGPSIDSSYGTIQGENLASDIFPVLSLPNRVYVATTNIGSRDAVFSMLGEGTALPPFAIRADEHKVYSFYPLDDKQSKLSELLSEKSTSSVPTQELLRGKQPSVLVELLNRAMTSHMRNIGMTYDWNTQKTFYPLETDTQTAREARWRVGGRDFSRKLVVRSKAGDYYAHRSCKATFTELSDSLYLKIVPGWHFTTDGIKSPVSSSKMSSLSTRWMNIERNHTVLDNVRFWAYVLSKDSDRILLSVGTSVPTEISAIPVFASVEHGIEGDYRERLWYEAPPEADEAETEFRAEEVEPLETTEEI